MRDADNISYGQHCAQGRCQRVPRAADEPDRREWGAQPFATAWGFTLVELMMTITLIAILAALLLPALSRAEGKSQSTICRGNLGQLGIGLRMYLNDSGEVYPYVANIPAPTPRGASYWFDALATSNPNARWGDGIFKCPAYQGVVYSGESRFDARGQLWAVYSPCGSYAYNALGRRNTVPGASGSISPGLGFSLSSGRPNGQPVRERDVKAPADLYVFGDAPLATAPWGTVSTLRLGGAADYDSLAAANATIEKAQHSLVFNMVLADGHTESVSTRNLLSTNDFYRCRWNHDNLP
jgi:prepilin-type N-terminal cleavage/methylation domain-containing protein